MAEVFSTVTGALSVAALFNNCVTCFEYVQLGRNFGRDFQACVLRLDTARTRLGRWGEAVNVYQDPRFAADDPGDDTSARLAQSIIEEIILLVQGAQKTSRRYELSPEPNDLGLLQAADMTAVGQRLHDRAGALARRRQKSAGMLKKTAWALYDGKQFERLVGQITALVDDLERLFPVDVACRRLVEMEIEQVDDEASLVAMREAAKDTDEVLLAAVDRKMNSIAGWNSARDIRTEDNADVQVGHRYAGSGPLASLTDQTRNSAETISAKGYSRVHIGNRFGSC